MQNRGSSDLKRNGSQLSHSSQKSAGGRSRSRKQSLVTPNSAKSLVSFPSLSPENSPVTDAAGKFASPPLGSPTSTGFRKPSKPGPSIVEALLKTNPSFRGRSALFDESPKKSRRDVPGALHLSSDDHLRNLIAKSGAVHLVRQLAEDLAEREAEMTAFRRRTEARERELKKMLQEAEVSNLDIETRLHRIDVEEKDSAAAESQYLLSKMALKNLNSEERITSQISSISDMMDEAMTRDIDLALDLDRDYFDLLDNRNGHATIRASRTKAKETNGRSITSNADSPGRLGHIGKGWRDYLWNGNATKRRTSQVSGMINEFNNDIDARPESGPVHGGASPNVGLDNEIFQPSQRSITTRSSSSDTQSKVSSTSIASWTMKLFAGNPYAGRDPDNLRTVRGRSATTGSSVSRNSRTSSAVPEPGLTAKAALLKVNNMSSDTRTVRKTVRPLTLTSNGATKPVAQTSGLQQPVSPDSTGAAANLGPVEMDTILPLGSKPPTLTQSHNNANPSDPLTDRFGFIYDQRRRKREADALGGVDAKKLGGGLKVLSGAPEAVNTGDDSSISEESQSTSFKRPDTPTSTEDKNDEKPAKRWQDYLKVATFPTELLSHTPLSNPLSSVIKSDPPMPKRSPTFGDMRCTLPSNSSNPIPQASPVTASNAEISKLSTKISTARPAVSAHEAEPVRILLAQLTELHDSLQRERTVKWNEFLRKVRAGRKKEGEALTNTENRSKQALMPEAALADGEMIGVAGLGNKGKVGRAKWQEFKHLVLAGIPVAYRAKVWAECSGASAMKIPGYYEDLVSRGSDDPIIVAQIEMDIHRTLTDNVFFRSGPGVTKLHEVLLAYSRRNPEVGYCQGMNLIAASLLLIMPSAEEAFWVLASMVENILPPHYYDHSLLASRVDQQVLRQYVAELLPRLSAHLDKLSIELEALTFQWFLSVFTDCLSAEALFRVWDVVLCFNDGSTFLFQVALALLKLNETPLMACESAASAYSYIGHEMTGHAISIDGLVAGSDALGRVVKRGEVEERRRKALEEELIRGRAKDANTDNLKESMHSGLLHRGRSEGVLDMEIQEPISIDEEK